MEPLFYLAWIAIISQLIFMIGMVRNFKYTLTRIKKTRDEYCPATALIVPCKGIDPAFDKNIASFYAQDYNNYSLLFVVEAASDPAYQSLCLLKEKLSPASKAKQVQILVAGLSNSSSQKIHNLLYAYKNIPPQTEVLAFADSDACIKNYWLKYIVHPLSKPKYGASSGYRWFVPQKSNLATLALSALNAKIAQLLGNTRFNQPWGGSMAIKVDTFKNIGLEKIWSNALSDDYSLGYAVKKAKLIVAFVPYCLVASYETTTWPKLFEFARRQYLITKVYVPGTWAFALFSGIYSVLCLWGGLVLTIRSLLSDHKYLFTFAALTAVFYLCQLARSFLRQTMIRILLKNDRSRLTSAMIADIVASPFFSILMLALILSSAFGRTIKWRGIKYKLVSPEQTIRLK